MSDEFKDFTVTPTLTFDAPQEAAPVVEIKKEEPVEPQLDESVLSDAERKMVDDFSKQIEFRSHSAVRGRNPEKDGGFFRGGSGKGKDKGPG